MREDFNRSLNMECFFGCFQLAGEANKYASFQLWNPVDSGVHLIFDEAEWSTEDETEINLQMSHVNFTFQFLLDAENKYLGRAGGSGQFRADQLDSVLIGNPILYTDLAAKRNPYYKFEPRRPFVIPEGRGLVFQNTTLNQLINMTVQWLEIPNP